VIVKKRIRVLLSVPVLVVLAAAPTIADCTQSICWDCFHFFCWGQGNYCECEASQVPLRYCVAGGGTCHVTFAP